MRVSFDQLPPIVHDLDAWLATGHKALFSKTGGGKSRILKHIHTATSLRSLFVSAHGDLPPGIQAQAPHDVARLLASGAEKIVWRAPKIREAGSREEAVRQLGIVVNQLLAIGERLLRQSGLDALDPWLVVQIDEAHNFTSKTGYPGPVEELLMEGRKFGIRVLIASPRPARVSLEVIGQADRIILLRLEPPDAKYLRRADYPVDEMRDWLEHDKHFAIMDGQRWVAYRPLGGCECHPR